MVDTCFVSRKRAILPPATEVAISISGMYVIRSPYDILVWARATGRVSNALFAGVWDVLDVA